MTTSKSKEKKQTKTFWIPERIVIAVCLAIIFAFVLFVTIATQGSLSGYMSLHAILILFLGLVLFLGKSKFLLYSAVVLALLGALSAIGLTLAYLPYYMQYLDYIHSIE